MALGIGANTTGFTIVNAAFLRGLPFEEADRLYMLTWINQAGRRVDLSPGELQDWRDQSRTFAAIAAYRDDTMNISDDRGFPEEARGTWITANGFGVIRQRPLLGRDFLPGEDRPGAEPVAIISHDLWNNRYASDARILGQVVRINGQPATIVGVMPENLRFPDKTDVWTPFVISRARDARPLTVFGRLADGALFREAQAEMAGIAQQQVTAYPEATRDLVSIRVETFSDAFVGGMMRPMLYTVMGAVVFVLLIACANVASLLLSRSAFRVARDRAAHGDGRLALARDPAAPARERRPQRVRRHRRPRARVRRRRPVRQRHEARRLSVLDRLHGGLHGLCVRRGALHRDRRAVRHRAGVARDRMRTTPMC